MDIIISNSSNQPIYEQIQTQIKNAIISGNIQPLEILPSIRVLAKELRISVITVKRAYDELEAEGYLETVVGKGCFVSQKNKELMREEQLKKIETKLQEVVDMSKTSKISLEEIKELITLLYEED